MSDDDESESDYETDDYEALEAYDAMLEVAIAGGDIDFVNEYFTDWASSTCYSGTFLCSFLEQAAIAGHTAVVEKVLELFNKESEYSIRDDRRMECLQNCIRLAVEHDHFDACIALIGDSERWDDDDEMQDYIAGAYYQFAYDEARDAGKREFCQYLLMAARPGRIFGDYQPNLEWLLCRELSGTARTQLRSGTPNCATAPRSVETT